jgi:subtilisin family serine protease
MVRVADYSTIEAFLELFNQDWPGTTIERAIESRKTYLLDLPDGADLFALLADLANYVNPNPAIPDPTRPLLWSESNWEGRASEGRTGSIYFNQAPDLDGEFLNQYALNRMNVPQAQVRSQGQGIVVAVLDTGVDATHPALEGRVLEGYNWIELNSDTRDVIDPNGLDAMVGHGTYVAGLVTLVAPQAKILPVRVLNGDGVGDAFILAQGMYYAIDRGVEVLNLSLGSTYHSQAVDDAVDEARSLGIVTVAAAGNMNREEPEEYPAMTSAAFGIAAVDHADIKADFSNYNDKVFLSVPANTLGDAGGFDPNLAIYGPVPGGDYAVWEGTSFATAMASGVVAMIRAQHPEWPAAEQTVFATAAVFEASAVNIDGLNPQFEEMLGVGRIDAAAALSFGPPAPELGDLNNDGSIGQEDLGIVLAHWGQAHSPADLDGDGIVGQGDLGIVLALWD